MSKYNFPYENGNNLSSVFSRCALVGATKYSYFILLEFFKYIYPYNLNLYACCLTFLTILNAQEINTHFDLDIGPKYKLNGSLDSAIVQSNKDDFLFSCVVFLACVNKCRAFVYRRK